MDKEAVDFIMKKSRKLFKSLFAKYTNKCIVKKTKGFDSLKSKYELITLGEFKKMLSDNKIGSNLITKEEVATLFRLINSKAQRADVQSLTYEGFVECFFQTAFCIYSKPPYSFSSLPLVASVKDLLSKFESAAAERGEDTLLFTDPEAATLGTKDQEMLHQLNAMLCKSPNYPLPEGFKKVQEKEIAYFHKMTNKDFDPIENIKISAEILDKIILDIAGIHFIEPKSEYTQKIKVIPDLLQANKPLQLEHPVDPDSKKLVQLDYKSKTWKTEELKKSIKTTEISWPIIPIQIKIVIAKMPIEMRKIGIEVAGVVEEMLKAVETGKSSLKHNCATLNIINKKKLDIKEEQKKIELEKEEKRKIRQKELKKILEVKKPSEKDEEKTKKQKVDKEQIKKAIEEINKRAEERATKKTEEKEKFAKEEKLKKREEKEKRLKQLEPFIKKKREEYETLIKETAEQKIKEKAEAEKKEANKKAQMEQDKKKILEEEVKLDKKFSEQIKVQNEELSKVLYI